MSEGSSKPVVPKPDATKPSDPKSSDSSCVGSKVVPFVGGKAALIGVSEAEKESERVCVARDQQ